MSTVKANTIEPASGGTVTITGAALTTPAIGTPASGTLTNCTGLPASSVVNTPAGGISATNVQTALNELDTEKPSSEQGTWTPVIRGSGTAGTESGTKSATYTKIGNRVMARLSLITYTLSGATGNILLTGLPFTGKWNGLVVYAEGLTPAYTAAIGSGGALAVSNTTSSGSDDANFRPSVSATWDNYLTASTTWTGGGGSSYIHIELWGTV